MNFLTTKISDYLVDLGLAAGINHFKSKVDRNQLKRSLKQYIESLSKYNELCSLAEEIDFGPIMYYIQNNLIDDVEERLFAIDQKARGRARKQIIDKALCISTANTNESRDRVVYFVSVSMEMIRGFYKKKVDKSLYLLATEIVDAVGEKIDESADRIYESFAKLTDVMQFSPQNIMALSESGDLSSIGDIMSLYLSSASEKHPLKPYYVYDYSNGALISKAVSKEASKKYPPRFLCKGTIMVGDKTLSSIDDDLINYADRHQLKIVFKANEVTKYLGDIKDPSQNEIGLLLGQEIVREPKPFPPAIPCRISIDGEILYDYVELRTEEILDDGTYIVGNKEQNGINTRFTIRFNYSDPSKNVDYSIRLNNGASFDQLIYAKMMKGVSSGGKVEIYALNLGHNLIEGKLNPPSDYKSDFETIDKEIDFFERICDIEKFYLRNIECEKEIYESDYNMIYYLSELIRGNKIKFNYDTFTFEMSLTNEFRTQIHKMDNNPCRLLFIGKATIKIFNITYPIRIARCFKSIQIKDFDRISKLVDLLSDGEPIRVTYEAVDDNTVIDYLYKGDD